MKLSVITVKYFVRTKHFRLAVINSGSSHYGQIYYGVTPDTAAPTDKLRLWLTLWNLFNDDRSVTATIKSGK